MKKRCFDKYDAFIKNIHLKLNCQKKETEKLRQKRKDGRDNVC